MLSILTLLWMFFHLAKLLSIPAEQHPILCPPHLATTPPLSVSMNLTTLSTLYKWDYMVLVFLRLAYFTWHRVFRFHPCWSMC